MAARDSMQRDPSTRSFWIIWAAAAAVAVLPVVLATLPPVVGPTGRAVLMQAFAPFCHQMPGRSPHLLGIQLAVGHRVYGILLGLAAGGLAFPFLARWEELFSRHSASLVVAAGVPTAIDWALGALGLWANTPVSRMGTGALFGVLAGYYLTRGLIQVGGSPSIASLTEGDTSPPDR